MPQDRKDVPPSPPTIRQWSWGAIGAVAAVRFPTKLKGLPREELMEFVKLLFSGGPATGEPLKSLLSGNVSKMTSRLFQRYIYIRSALSGKGERTTGSHIRGVHSKTSLFDETVVPGLAVCRLGPILLNAISRSYRECRIFDVSRPGTRRRAGG